MIRKIKACDENEFLNMEQKFYSSSAVLHTVPIENIKNAFKYAINESPYLDIFIVENEKNIIGYGLTARTFSLEGGGETVWIEELYIKEEFQGKGYGQELLNFILSVYKVARFRLEISPQNKTIEKLYKTKGFVSCPYLQMIKENKNGK